MGSAVQLRVVWDEPEPEGVTRQGCPAGPDVPDRGDVSLLALLFLLNAIPVAGDLAGVGRWSPGLVGFAVAAMLLTGRELWSQLCALARAKTERTGSP